MAGARSDGTLVGLVDRYTGDRVAGAEASRRTAHEQRLTLLQFADSFGRRPVARMSEADIIRWLGTTGDLQPSTRRNKLSVVKGFCRWLVRNGHVRKDPAAGVRSPRQPRTVPKVFDATSVAAVLTACPDARARLIVLLMVQEGLRCGEVAGLEARTSRRSRPGLSRALSRCGAHPTFILGRPPRRRLGFTLGRYHPGPCPSRRMSGSPIGTMHRRNRATATRTELRSPPPGRGVWPCPARALLRHSWTRRRRCRVGAGGRSGGAPQFRQLP